jgi:glycosyltransferase involved in cell wall biosynthesis
MSSSPSGELDGAAFSRIGTAHSPRVSVVLPVWNGERYFEAAVRSILEQTFESFELLIVDDGSTDQTLAIARRWGAMDSRIRLIRVAHGGIANALNTGFRQARAPYVARMDADDISLPSRLQRQVAYLDSHQRCVVVGCDTEVIDENENDLGVINFPCTHARLVHLLLSGSGSPFVHPAVMMRADAVRAVGGYRPEHCPSEDYELWLRLINSGEFASIPERLLRYRMHRDSVSAQGLHLQAVGGNSLLNATRVKIGWPALRRKVRVKKQSALAVYHNRCSRIAMKSGRRALAISHAFSGITSAPRWIQLYTSLAACALPVRAIPRLIKCARWLRTI